MVKKWLKKGKKVKLHVLFQENKAVITNPCRSNLCSHPEVFDLVFFLEKMQYYLKWPCPVCTKFITYESLELDT